MFPVFWQQIMLRDKEGGATPFDPAELTARIADAFRNSGQESESYVADDIVTALMYTLKRVPKKELIFNQGEIDSAVIRILESSGFPETARRFRESASEQLLQLATGVENLTEFLTAHLGCSMERLNRIAQICAQALDTLKISSASPHLLIELARHYERELAEEDLRSAGKVSRGNGLSKQEILKILPETATELINAGVLETGGISAVFPGIRFRFSMEKFAELKQLGTPVTELELHPELYKAGMALEEARQEIQKKFPGETPLPCLISRPDMIEYLTVKAGCSKADKLAAELAAILCSELKTEVYQLSFE